jgi:hypothetical protein
MKTKANPYRTGDWVTFPDYPNVAYKIQKVDGNCIYVATEGWYSYEEMKPLRRQSKRGAR